MLVMLMSYLALPGQAGVALNVTLQAQLNTDRQGSSVAQRYR